MAEETIQNPPEAPAAPAPEASVLVEEVVVTEAEKPEAEKAVPEAEKPAAEVVTDVPVHEEEQQKKIAQQPSFKEETNVVSELPESQKKALDELRKLIQEALEKHEFTSTPPAPVPSPAPTKEEEKKVEEEKKEGEQPPAAAPEAEKPAEEAAPPAEAEKPKVEEEASKLEEVAAKTEEEPANTEKAPQTEEEAPAPGAEAEVALIEEETKEEEKQPEAATAVEEEKTVEAIKETIVEVAATPAAEEAPKTEESTPVAASTPEEVSIWGIPLLADERSDVILLKFLRARDFRVKDAWAMIKNTVRWRKEFGVDSLLEEDLGSEYEKVVFTHGHDKEGRPVVYNVFGEFQNKELYQNTFSDAEKRKKFLKWLIQFLEKTIRTLDFSPKGINTLILVNDFKNSPGFGKRDLYKVIDKFLELLQDNYPEFIAKQLCINVSWWYLAYNWIYLTIFTPRSKSKFVFASPSKTPETLFKYIAPEQVPVQFGGHSKEDGGEHEFSPVDPVTEVTLKPGSKHPIEFALSEGTELVWELRVIGWEVSYGAEFLPSKEGGYTLNVVKPRKVTPTDEPIICDTFKVTEAGKVVLTIDNQSTKKKKLFYRSKIKA